MVPKEGDELGIEPIRERLEKDGQLMEQVYSVHGISKILLRNSIPQNEVLNFSDSYEITPEYDYFFNSENGKVQTKNQPWKVMDDEGILSNSLMPPPVVVSLIKQLVNVLGL